MKNVLIAISLACALITGVQAKGSSQTPTNTTVASGIITPDVAVGFETFTHFKTNSDGYLVVCRNEHLDRGKCNQWERAEAIVPKERSYVGFRVIQDLYTYRNLVEIYWK